MEKHGEGVQICFFSVSHGMAEINTSSQCWNVTAVLYHGDLFHGQAAPSQPSDLRQEQMAFLNLDRSAQETLKLQELQSGTQNQENCCYCLHSSPGTVQGEKQKG